MSNVKSKIKSIADIEHNECRWPIGDPRDADFHFCGAQQHAGHPYCELHWKMSFVPSKARGQSDKPQVITRRAA